MSPFLLSALVLLAAAPAYALLLRFSRRYTLNRCVLLFGLVAVCLLPFVQLPSPTPELSTTIQTTLGKLGTGQIVEWGARPQVPAEVPGVGEEQPPQFVSVPATSPLASFSIWWWLYGAGVAGMLGLLCLRLIYLTRLHLRSRPEDGGYRVLAVSNASGQAFTFGRTIYVSDDQPAGPDFEYVLAHERVHARQWHSLDLLLSEVFVCLWWFHPVAWWLRNRLRANLEYLVDETVVREGRDRRGYQLALVRQSQGISARLGLALPFSEVALRGRIERLTGMPQYRFLAILATVGLFCWLGVAALLLRGTAGPPADTHEYLAASAGPGDPYYDYYQRTLPAEVTSVEVYTNRMLTGDEYLRVRGILGKVPGAKLYVYKNQMDEDVSMELRTSSRGLVRAEYLDRTPVNVTMLGVERYPIEASREVFEPMGPFLPMSAFFWEERGMTIYTSEGEMELTLDVAELAPQNFAAGPLVYVNGKAVDLRTAPTERQVSVRINGQEVSKLSGSDWTRIRVEGRSLKTPRQRLLNIHYGDDYDDHGDYPDLNTKEFRTYRRTYREWYEEHNQPSSNGRYWYNDRKVDLDFLLDRFYDNNAMILVASDPTIRDGEPTVLVVDDYPEIGKFWEEARNVASYDATEISLYLKRMPMPREVGNVQKVLNTFSTKYELQLFKNCDDAEGNLTLLLDKPGEITQGYRDWPAGEQFPRPKQFKVISYNKRASAATTYGQTEWPDEAPNGEVVLKLGEEWMDLTPPGPPFCPPTDFATPAPFEQQRCQLAAYRPANSTFFDWGMWHFVYRSIDAKTVDALDQAIEKNGYGDRPREYAINGTPVSATEFAEYVPKHREPYVLATTFETVDQTPVLLWIVDEPE